MDEFVSPRLISRTTPPWRAGRRRRFRLLPRFRKTTVLDRFYQTAKLHDADIIVRSRRQSAMDACRISDSGWPAAWTTLRASSLMEIGSFGCRY